MSVMLTPVCMLSLRVIALGHNRAICHGLMAARNTDLTIQLQPGVVLHLKNDENRVSADQLK